MTVLRFLDHYGVLFSVATAVMLGAVAGSLLGLHRRYWRRTYIVAWATALAGTLLHVGIAGPAPYRVLSAGWFAYVLVREIQAYRKDKDDDDRPPRRRRRRPRRRWVPDLSKLALPAVLPVPGPA